MLRVSSCRRPFVLSGGLLPSVSGSLPPVWLTSSLQPQTKKRFSICPSEDGSASSQEPSSAPHSTATPGRGAGLPGGEGDSGLAAPPSFEPPSAHVLTLAAVFLTGLQSLSPSTWLQREEACCCPLLCVLVSFQNCPFSPCGEG